MITISNFYLSVLNRFGHSNLRPLNTIPFSPSKPNIIISRSLAEKKKHLERYISHLGSVLVAYSGDVESTYLAFITHKVLGDRMLALVADSPSLPRQNLREAIDFAKLMKIPVRSFAPSEREQPVKVESISCYPTKFELLKAMEHARAGFGFRHLALGVPSDDFDDFCPRRLLAMDSDVLVPLAEAELNREEIQTLAQHSGLLARNNSDAILTLAAA